MVFSLSSWEMAGVRAPARTERKPTSAGFFMVFSLAPWERAGVRAPARTEHKNKTRLSGFFLCLLFAASARASDALPGKKTQIRPTAYD